MMMLKAPPRTFCAAVAAFLLLAAGAPRAQDVVISEFMASGGAGVSFEGAPASDWIEVYNPSSETVNLLGWSLTDDSRDMAKWPFPDMDLRPGEFLLVLATGQDLRDPAGELHTNFSLSSDGEFLAIVRPNGIPSSFFAPSYPQQVTDASYGAAMEVSSTKILTAGAGARYFVPDNNDLERTWTEPAFDDSAWQSGPTGIGFDTNDPQLYQDLIQTDVASLVQGVSNPVYIRIPFEVEAAAAGSPLRLSARYNDGFIVYVNGVEVARRGYSATADPRDTYRASKTRSEEDTRIAEEIPLRAAGLLQPGTNLLAIHLLKRSRSDADSLVVPELELLSVTSVSLETQGYFAAPTPGWPNGTPLPGIAAEPELSLPPGAYSDAAFVELSTPVEGAEIRYTLDGFAPTEESTLYTEPIPIDDSMVVKARSFKDGLLPSSTVTSTYVRVDSSVANFTSNIPVVLCTTIGRAIGSNCGGGAYTPGHFMIFEPGGDGRTHIGAEAHLGDIAAFRKRGSSTCGRPKFSFNVEIKESFDPEKTTEEQRALDPLGVTKNVEIFGFPRDSDYIMYGPYNFDRGLMRNALAYWLSREVGRWAARTRFVECFFHNGRADSVGAVSMANYMGVYVFMEKNKRHADRIPVERLTAADTEEPEVAGGYILRRDRIGAGEVATSAGGYGSLVFVYPKLPAAAQRAYITGYINQAIASLSPNIGSQEDSDLIDVGEWLDHHILNWYPKNVDAFRLSGYFHKKRNGLLAMGPVWDYDRTMGCADDNRASSPIGWDNTASGDGGTRYFQAGGLGSWYSILFQNAPPTGPSPWATAYRQRWRELRKGPLRTDNIVNRIESWGAELDEAAQRNFAKWAGTRPRFGSFQGEVNHLRDWMVQRAEWIDSQFIEPPTFDPPPPAPGELVEPGLEVTISAEVGDVYYTLDGSDPKTTIGGVAETATLYGGPITVSANVRIRARLRVSATSWSEVSEAIYVTSLLPLAITELMYDAPDFPDESGFRASKGDFLEIQNIGNEAIDLKGVRISAGPRFTFEDGDVTALEPGEFLVVVDDLEAFRYRYGDSVKVAGEYGGSLRNSGQRVEFQGSVGEVLFEVTYDDDWYPEASDKEGRSIVLRDTSAPREVWDSADGWRASTELLGSPGREDPESAEGGLQRPGDVSQNERIDVTDGIQTLLYLFGGRDGPCATVSGNEALMDTNGDAKVDTSDAVYLMTYLFLRGPAPAAGVQCVRMPGCPDACGAP